jgi:hypothetical protein
MAVIKKTLFPKNLEKFAVLVDDTQSDSKYFKITELPDTFTGGKNAFLIAGSEYLVPDTKIQIELKDSAGNIIYHEPGEGLISASVNGESFITEYYEGVSKVVAVYVYPDTSYGPCTLTILGELSEYEDTNGITLPVPLDWENKYNVKWQKQIDVNPSLANTTKIRFYRRPTVNITELVEPVYRIESGSKVNSGINQSFASIKISNLETFAGDVKRVKVFRTSFGDISDFSLIQDILVESKELLTTFGLSGSVVGNTGIFTSETLKNYWNTGSLNTQFSNNRIESGIKTTGNGKLTYTSSLDLKSANTYELNLDAFYSASISSNLGIYLSYVSQSTTFISSIATLAGTQPTKNLLDTTIPFKIDRDYPSASLYFSQSRGEWHLGNISLKLSQDTAFSPDEVSFITTMPTVIGNEDFNFKFEFYDVNNNYVPVFVTQSANFTGGSNAITKLLTFESDRTAFRFSTGSFANPPNQNVRFKTIKTNFTGSITYASSAFDVGGNYIQPSLYAGTYPGWFTSQNDNGALLSIASFSGSVNSVLVGSIVYTASCEGFQEFETIYRFEDGDNAPGVFVTANTNQFIYKATDLSPNPAGQVITIEAKRKNLGSSGVAIVVTKSGNGPNLTLNGANNDTTGVQSYTLTAGSGTGQYRWSYGETIYTFTSQDQFGNQFSDSIKISPVKILDGLSVSLTNDNASLPARSTGFVESGSFVLSSGSVSVKVGNEIITHSNGLSANNRFDVVSAVATNVQTGSLDYSTTDYFITRLDADSGSLNLTIRYKDGAGDTSDTTKLVTYTKAKIGTPNVVVAVSPSAQSISSNSRGSGSATPTPLTITALEGNTSRFTSIGTPTYTNGLAGTISTNTITFTSNASSMFSDTGQVTIPVNYTDSEGVPGTKNIIATVSKSKTAVPTIIITATPQAQSVLANAAGVQTGILTDVVVSALEGSTSRFTSMTATYTGFSTNPTISTNSNILTMTSAVMNAAEASATIVVTHTDSEGTTGQTKTIIARFTKVPTGTAGANGVNGADGGTGPGVVYRGDWAPNTAYYSSSIRVDVVRGSDSEYYLTKIGHVSSATGTIDKPITGTSYTNQWRPFGATFESVATDILLARDATITRGLVMGTYGVSDKGFIRSANASALMAGKGYYLDTTGSMRFGDPDGGYIKFTESEGVTIAGSVSISGTTTIGGTSATTVKDGAASGATAQQNGSAKTAGSVGGWSIDSDAIWSGTKDTDGYSTTGITLNSGGSIHAPQFYIDTSGNAFFKGNISGASGTFTGNVQIGTGVGRTLISNTEFQDVKEADSIDNLTHIGPEGIQIKGTHDTGKTTANSYIDLRVTSGLTKISAVSYEPTETIVTVQGFPYSSLAAMQVTNGGLSVSNFSQTENGVYYAGTGNAGYAIQSFGNFYCSAAGFFDGDVTANTSDKRLKTNIKNIDSPLEKISKINGVYFNWNDKAKELADKNTEIREVGFIAQEVQSVLPEIIKAAPFDVINSQGGSKSGENYLTIQYEKIVPLLVECIKELKKEIEELKNK